MLRNVHEQTFKAGEVIYSANADAKFLYLLHQGSVQLASPVGRRVTIDSTRFGEEAATDVPHYLSDAIALTDVVAFAIPRASLAGLNQYNPGRQAEYYYIAQVMPRQFLVYIRAPLMAEHQISLPPIYEAFARASNNYYE